MKMNPYHIATILIIFFSCTDKKTIIDEKEGITSKHEVIVSGFQAILDRANLKGSILIYDLKEDVYYSNDFLWAKRGKLPASTFKIAHSIIVLESGVVENDSSLLEWKGENRRLKIWEQNLTLKEAFQYSCVPCYQQIARKIGQKRMSAYLNKLEYGNMTVDSTNIDLFWLHGTSRITQFQQIDFLTRFYQSKLPISERTESILKKMMLIEENVNYTLRGKTGWSISNGKNNAWFVGYLENQSKTYFFATNIEPDQSFDMDLFPMVRKDVTFKAFKQMKLL